MVDSYNRKGRSVMKPQEAIGIMKIALAEVDWEYPMDYAVAFETAIEALEKQVPKKPVDEFSTYALYDNDGNYSEQLDITTFKCPNCNDILASGDISISDCHNIHYCENCGQALLWED